MSEQLPDSAVQARRRRLVPRPGTIGRWTLRVVVLGLALIGFLHVTRGTVVRDVEGVSGDGASISVGEPEFPLMATMATGAWLAPGNRVEVLQDGDGTFPRLWNDLRSAQRSITLQLYYGAPGRMADTLSGILRERARAGVRVVVLYDAFGTVDIPKGHRDALRAAGIVVQPFRPIRLSTLHLAQHRSHVRGVVIDSRIGWTGGFGIDDKWLGDGRTDGSWRETNVRFEGPAVRQLQAAFAAAWVEATGMMFTGRATLDTLPDGVTAAGLLYATPTLGSTAAERFYALSIAAARETLYITNSYFAPDRNFIDLLVAAARRGRRRADPDRRTAHRRQGRAARGTILVRHAALSRRARVRVGADDAARQDVCRRRRMVHRRVDEFRQPVDGPQRRGDVDGARSQAGRRDEPHVSRGPAALAGSHTRPVPWPLVAAARRRAQFQLADAAAVSWWREGSAARGQARSVLRPFLRDIAGSSRAGGRGHGRVQVADTSTREFLQNYMEEFHQYIARVYTVLPRHA